MAASYGGNVPGGYSRPVQAQAQAVRMAPRVTTRPALAAAPAKFPVAKVKSFTRTYDLPDQNRDAVNVGDRVLADFNGTSWPGNVRSLPTADDPRYTVDCDGDEGRPIKTTKVQPLDKVEASPAEDEAYAEPTTGCRYLAPEGYDAPLASGDPAPMTTSPGYTAPQTTTYAAPMTTGYTAPTTTRYAAPTTTSYAAPMTTGYTTPLPTRFTAPMTTNYAAPMTTGYAAPTTAGYAAPMTYGAGGII